MVALSRPGGVVEIGWVVGVRLNRSDLASRCCSIALTSPEPSIFASLHG